MPDREPELLESRFAQAVATGDTGPALAAIREGNRIFDEGGLDAITPLFDPELELDTRPLLLDGRLYTGIDGFELWRTENAKAMEYDRFEPCAVRYVGTDLLLVFGRLKTKGRGSGVETDVPLTHAYEFRDGKILRLTLYADACGALAAAGVSD